MKTEQKKTIIAAFKSALNYSPERILHPDIANEIASILGFNEIEIFDIAGQLQTEGLINIEWGGKIKLTNKALEFLKLESTSSTVNMGPNSVYAPGAGKILTGGAVDNSISITGVDTDGGAFNVVHGDSDSLRLKAIDQLKTTLDLEAKKQVETLEALRKEIDTIGNISSETKPLLQQKVGQANGIIKELGETAKSVKLLSPYLMEAGVWLGATAGMIMSSL